MGFDGTWLQHVTILYQTPSLLPWRTVTTDGAHIALCITCLVHSFTVTVAIVPSLSAPLTCLYLISWVLSLSDSLPCPPTLARGWVRSCVALSCQLGETTVMFRGGIPPEYHSTGLLMLVLIWVQKREICPLLAVTRPCFCLWRKVCLAWLFFDMSVFITCSSFILFCHLADVLMFFFYTVETESGLSGL